LTRHHLYELAAPTLAIMSSGKTGGPGAPEGLALGFDALIDQLVTTADGIRQAQGRLRGLMRAIESVTGDLSLELVLRNIVEAARDLADAQYGALGVISREGGLAQFIHSGIPDDVAERIGDLPQGKGLLGALITDPRPIRLERMGDDARSSGFPPNHPEMESFLGVPIRSRGEIFGNLYLANSGRGAFSAEDQELVLALATAAGTAISNARQYAESQLQQRWLEASVEIGSQLLALDGEDPLQLVGRRAKEIAVADVVAIGLLAPNGEDLVVEVAYGDRADELIAMRYQVEGTLAGLVMESGEPQRLSNAAADGRSVVGTMVNGGPIIMLPLRGVAGTRGVLTLLRRQARPSFSSIDLQMAAGFAAHASVALELAEARSADQRLRLMEDRERIARDLHDHVIQELFGIGMGLEGVAAEIQSAPLAERVNRRIGDLDRTIRRIRTSIFQLRGNLGSTSEGATQRVLRIAAEMTQALGFAPHVAFAGLVEIRVKDEVIEDCEACVRELLSNVARHAHATSASVDVELVDDVLTVTVSDNGIGPAGATARSSGLANLRDRAERRSGSFELRAGPSNGSVATWTVRVK
jgi:signal transduction histidine kinase